MGAERDIAKVFADLESFKSNNFVVKWRKSEIVDFFLVTKRFPKKKQCFQWDLILVEFQRGAGEEGTSHGRNEKVNYEKPYGSNLKKRR